MVPCRHQYYPSLGRRACLRYGGPDSVANRQGRIGRVDDDVARALLSSVDATAISPRLSHRWAYRHPARHLVGLSGCLRRRS